MPKKKRPRSRRNRQTKNPPDRANATFSKFPTLLQNVTDEKRELRDRKNIPRAAIALSLLAAIVVAGQYLDPYITAPKGQSTTAQAVLAFIVGVLMGCTVATLTIAFLTISLTDRSDEALTFHEKLAQRAALGAIYGTLLAIRASAHQLGREGAELDLIDVVARVTMLGTLAGISTCLLSSIKALSRSLAAIRMRDKGSFTLVAIPCVVGLLVAIGIIPPLMHGRGW
ncbi:hypothetical protein [Nocardia sp. NBC_00403]|uniref:hypothetical protein n=1 Tax=Nocardia sp. NBC_00403 TaxID=2975990 RepID=UPI002E1CDCD9